MNPELIKVKVSGKTLVKRCHVCGHFMESKAEIRKCECCNKSFLPSNYFGKVHAKNSNEFDDLYCDIEELAEEDLVKGIHVIW